MARKTIGNKTTNRSKKTGAAVQLASEVPSSGKTPSLVPINLEEEIRCRAYELYLQRRATAGGDNGDENQDWLIAESEILSRHGRLADHTTA